MSRDANFLKCDVVRQLCDTTSCDASRARLPLRGDVTVSHVTHQGCDVTVGRDSDTPPFRAGVTITGMARGWQ